MTLAAIMESLSTPRFSTYQRPLLGGQSSGECLGIYLWNKQLAGAFLPALQIIEISLRNAINQSWLRYEAQQITLNAETGSGENNPPQPDTLWFVNAFNRQDDPVACSNLNTARKQLIAEKKR